MSEINRRELLRTSARALAGAAAGAALSPFPASAARPPRWAEWQGPARLRFAAIGLNHGHIYGQVEAVKRGGGELVSFYAEEPELIAQFRERYPDVKLARSRAEILEDPSIQLVVSAAIPDERAPLGIQVMRHGKAYMADKPGITTLEQLAEVRRVQAETGRIYAILFSERATHPATVKAGEMARAGAIGDVLQTIGLGPHRMRAESRPPWFFHRDRYGGIITDIGSHQTDQFLWFTGSTTAEVVASQVGNLAHPQYPRFEDFGDAMLRGNGGTGYLRVDWFTPEGLPTWGDGRLTVLGTEGYIEVRKYVDIGGREGGNHLFLVDGKGVHRIPTDDVEVTYGRDLVDDVLNRTETAMSQEHVFLATELALKAQAQAERVDQGPA